ncbi:ParB/RepB/Spo0J family partition protein [Bradyrhizobium sp. B120]|uniref:ParB/RepB/Spo0J family partition protein n=1 Tax=Bradyrhizobium sp. B120 TaxID=3410088 RepID=UPI003B97D60C
MTTKAKSKTNNSAEIFVPLNKLKKSPKHARKVLHTEAAIAALAASIAYKGMLQNLVVEPEVDDAGAATGFYLVTIGEGRRLAQLLRVQRKEIKKSEPMRCTVDLANDPTEISLDENVTRSDLHPADQYEVFRYLAEEKGRGVEDIAARFGVTAHVVRQRLRLAAVSPNLIQTYRDGGLTLDQLIAFSIVGDHERQEAAFERLAPNPEPYMIRRILLEAKVPARDRRARFVGLEAYEAAGGSILRDLFSESQDGFLEDVALLDRLTKEKLDSIAARLCEQEGWKWAEVHLDFPHAHGLRRLYPSPVDFSPEDAAAYEAAQSAFNALTEQYDDAEELPDDIDARFGELEAEIERLDAKREAYGADVKVCSGAFVVLNHDGTARIERGFVRRDDEKLLNAEQADGSPVTDSAARVEGASTGDEGMESEGNGGKSLSDVLARDLTAHRTLGLRLALGEQPHVALLAAVHALVARTFYRQEVSCLDIRPVAASLAAHAEGIDDIDAARALADRHGRWASQLPHAPSDLWCFIAELDHDSRMALFAHCVALTVFAVRAPWEQRPLAWATADTVASVLELDMNRYWKPTVRSYLGRVSKENILAAVREAAGPDAAERIAGMKKVAMAEAAEELLGGTGWLPRLMTQSAPQADDALVHRTNTTDEAPETLVAAE